jgi:hypothetical protein
VATGTVTSQATSASTDYDWNFSGPAPYVYRGPAGAYTVRTDASCAGGEIVTRTQVVVIEQKIARTTMSSAEFKQIKSGMTQHKVKRIVGYNGRAGGKYDGTVTRTYDSMPCWSYSSVTFRGGRVVAKSYDFDHD